MIKKINNKKKKMHNYNNLSKKNIKLSQNQAQEHMVMYGKSKINQLTKFMRSKKYFQHFKMILMRKEPTGKQSI